MTWLRFSIEGEPVPQGRPRFSRWASRVRTYTPAATAAWHRKVADAAERALAQMGEWDADAPLELALEFRLPIPASWPKWKRESVASGDLLHTAKPDIDNLTKAVLDGLNGVLFRDDSQVFAITAAKFYDATPGVKVSALPVPNAISSTTKRNPAKAAEEARPA